MRPPHFARGTRRIRGVQILRKGKNDRDKIVGGQIIRARDFLQELARCRKNGGFGVFGDGGGTAYRASRHKWILDFGFRISDFGFRISDFGFRISDFGFWIADLGNAVTFYTDTGAVSKASRSGDGTSHATWYGSKFICDAR